MNKEAREYLAAHRKWVILEYAKGIGNNKKACREFGVPKSTFYEWKKAYAKGGKAGLPTRASVKQHVIHCCDRSLSHHWFASGEIRFVMIYKTIDSSHI